MQAQTMDIGTDAVVTIGVGASISLGTAATTGNNLTTAANTSLVIESTASGSGSLICGGTPNATVNRYITDNEWHLVTPITNTSNVSDFYLGAPNLTWLAKHNESDNSWTYLTTIDSTISRPTGFSYWIDDGQGPQTIDFTGTLIGADVTATLAKSGDGWNLIGNPFPSAIDWDGVSAGITNGTSYVWDNDQSGYLYSTGGTGPTGSGGGTTVGTLPDNIIPMGQGFFVQATGAGSFTIPAANRVHSSNAFIKSSNSTNESNTSYIRIDMDGGYYGNTVFVGFPENGTDEFDINGDATKLYSSAENVQFFAVENGIELCVNANTPLNEGESKTVPLNMVQVTDGEYTLSFTDLDNMEEDISIVLEDLKEDYTQNVRELPTYTFSGSVGDAPNRFHLHFAWSPDGFEEDDQNVSGSEIRVYSYGKNISVVNNSNSSNDIISIIVYDIYGRQIISQQTSGQKIDIPMNYYSNKYFVVKVEKGNSVYTEKIFIK